MRCAAVLLPLATILIVVWPNLRGTAGTGAETFFDITDPLFGDATATAPRFHDDPSPVVYDWPRDRRLRERVRAGHFDLWNPVPGNGVPLSSDPGGIFSPFRLLLYAAPGDPYTAFVLFRVARLFVAALGTYLLARVCGLSRPGGAVAGIVFGLSGGMISQLPFATVASVCWLPWICWAQQRIALRGTAAAAVPHALAVAAAMTGGHQTIVTGVVLGALVHGAGVVAAQRSRGTWRRTALLAATGYGLGALLAAPAILASAELVANGHSYKAALPAAFRTASSEMNLSLLFVGAVIPQTIDALRTAAGFSYPYVLNFSGGLLAYVLATVAVVRRRWRFEWALLLLFGIAMCFGPPGFAWIAAVPFVKDILPRYMWALCMLPLALAAAAGADALWWRAGARDPVRAPARVATSAGTDGPARRAAAATVARAIALFAIATGAMAWITWHGFPGVGAAVTGALSASPHARLLAGAPAVAVVVTLTGAAALARLRRPWTPWLLAVATCIEVAAIALPHLREPPSRLIREDFPHETSDLADQIADEHGRVGGSAPLVVGWRGLR
ncbi:MAG: hypothetical protein ABUL77_05400, partial [Bacteroidota bacterium]